MNSMRELMCLLNIRTPELFQVITQIKNQELEYETNMSPLRKKRTINGLSTSRRGIIYAAPKTPTIFSLIILHMKDDKRMKSHMQASTQITQ